MNARPEAKAPEGAMATICCLAVFLFGLLGWIIIAPHIPEPPEELFMQMCRDAGLRPVYTSRLKVCLDGDNRLVIPDNVRKQNMGVTP